ncbi:hypothetical protein GUJ93_ZPchr0013g36034 [Zizania palustris]|uniref:Uncharacterized protein n=1 Tax=Zizania palustris TaxID=103762 RepID=A0A8J5WVU8_ZIZPA|nr:hypothetical protein GUJ93_ZPchr0013g36034 [Zizania palustris]
MYAGCDDMYCDSLGGEVTGRVRRKWPTPAGRPAPHPFASSARARIPTYHPARPEDGSAAVRVRAVHGSLGSAAHRPRTRARPAIHHGALPPRKERRCPRQDARIIGVLLQCCSYNA